MIVSKDFQTSVGDRDDVDNVELYDGNEPDQDELTMDIRGFEENDFKFVFKSWLNSFRRARPRTPASIYYPYQTRLINRLVQTSQIAIACDLEMRDFVMGYAIANPRPTFSTAPDAPLELHYAFTKLNYRKIGIFTALATRLGWNGRSPIYLSHWGTFTALEIAKKKKLPLIPVEYLCMELGTDVLLQADPTAPNYSGDVFYSTNIPLGARDPTRGR